MGTAAYMAPEQARGKTVDNRADIWAFGAVLFEMLPGARAFPGETISDTLAAVLTATPDCNKLPSGTPPAMRELIVRCLDRDPRQRLQWIGEARIILSNPRGGAVNATTGSKRGRSPGTVAAIAVTVGVLSAAAMMLWKRPTSAPVSSVRKLDLALDNVNAGFDHLPSISPDGTRFVYSAGGSCGSARSRISPRKKSRAPTAPSIPCGLAMDGSWHSYATSSCGDCRPMAVRRPSSAPFQTT